MLTPSPDVNTFSIAAYDPMEQAWGVAVASKVLGVGAIVPWVWWNVGAMALQSLPNLDHANLGKALLENGMGAGTTLNTILAEDPLRDIRQTGVVDASGQVANFTGQRCGEWAGSLQGKNFTCQGNLLTGGEVLTAMATAYQESDGDFLTRLTAALLAGDAAGGDSRGRQSAAVKIEKRVPSFYGITTHYVNIRVDDHEEPFDQLTKQIDQWRDIQSQLDDILEPFGGREGALADPTALEQAIRQNYFK